MNSSDLRKYLGAVVELEKRKYIQTTAIKELDDYIKSLGVHKKHMNAFGMGLEKDNIIALLCVAAWLILALVLLWLAECTKNKELLSRLMPVFSICAVLSFVVCAVLLALSIGALIADRIKSSRKQDEYMRETVQQRLRIKSDNDRVERERHIIKPRMAEQRKLLYDKYAETSDLLRRMYSMGVIIPKYRNLAAVCSFYEYLDSGRCSKLEGNGGAYSIYKDEVRRDLIVTRLNDAVAHLEQIEQHQHMLHSAIQTGERQAQQLVQSTKCLAFYDNVADQTAIEAQNSCWAAEELNTVKWLKSIAP